MRAVPTSQGNELGLTLVGELDSGTALQVNAAMTRSLPPGQPEGGFIFSLNLSGLSFCDAAGLDALADVNDRVSAQGGTLHVQAPAARQPRWLLTFAVSNGWLAAAFDPGPAHEQPTASAVMSATSDG